MAYQIINNVTVSNTINERVLGISLQFNGPGIFQPIYLSDIQARENLKNLLLTTPGERIENIEFGCELMNVIFEPNTDNLKQTISDIISSAVSFWLPYIDITEINVKSILDDPTLLYVVEIYLTFQVTGTVEEQTLSIQLQENGVVNIG
jgi:phage baseplate assembly protein W